MLLPDNFRRGIYILFSVVFLATVVYLGRDSFHQIISDAIEKEVKTHEEDKKLILDKVDFIRKDEDNKIIWNMIADRVVQEKESEQYDFQTVDITFFQEDDAFNKITSDEGWYYQRRKQFIFSGEVMGLSSKGMTLESEMLEYNTDSKEAIAHRNVRVKEEGSFSTGKLLKFYGDPKTFRSFEMIGDVNVLMEEKKQDENKKQK